MYPVLYLHRKVLFHLIAFKMIEGDQAILQKLAYICGNFVAVVLSVYKCNSMGLLPTHASDWLAFADVPQVTCSLRVVDILFIY